MWYFILILVVLVNLGMVFVQGEFFGGFKVGLNFNNFIGLEESVDEVFVINIGFYIGVFFVYLVIDFFGVKVELMYS